MSDKKRARKAAAIAAAQAAAPWPELRIAHFTDGRPRDGNCFPLALATLRANADRWLMVEGTVLGPLHLPIPHAWLVSHCCGFAYDPVFDVVFTLDVHARTTLSTSVAVYSIAMAEEAMEKHERLPLTPVLFEMCHDSSRPRPTEQQEEAARAQVAAFRAQWSPLAT